MELQLVATLRGSTKFNGCQIYKIKNHQAMTCPKYANSMLKCQKCGELATQNRKLGLGAIYVARWDMLKKKMFKAPKLELQQKF